MYRRIVLVLSTISLSFVVLSLSVLRSSSFKSKIASGGFPILASENESMVEVDYVLPYPGSILPDSPLWFLKVIRDKTWIFLTRDDLKQAELNLLFADKRLGASRVLFDNGKHDLGLSTLTKGEKYLEAAQKEEEQARKNGKDTSLFLSKLSQAALKHREVSDEILGKAPESLKPAVNQVEDYSKNVFKDARDALLSKGIEAPQSPFHD